MIKTASTYFINRISHRLGFAIATFLLCLATTLTVPAQSTNRDYPTPLTTNEIANDFHQNDPEMFYTFVAGPGAVTFTLDLQARNYGGALYVNLFDSRNHELAAFDGLVSKGQTSRVTRSVEFVKPTSVLMRIYSGNGQGIYRLRLDGPVSAGYPSGSSLPAANGYPGGIAGQQPLQPVPSTDRDNPTPLDTSEIADEFHQDDPEYFYGFISGPGTVTFTLDLQARNYGGALYVTLFDERGKQLAAFDGLVMKGQSNRVIKQVNLVKEMAIVMRIYSGNGQGTYRLHIDEGAGGQPSQTSQSAYPLQNQTGVSQLQYAPQLKTSNKPGIAGTPAADASQPQAVGGVVPLRAPGRLVHPRSTPNN